MGIVERLRSLEQKLGSKPNPTGELSAASWLRSLNDWEATGKLGMFPMPDDELQLAVVECRAIAARIECGELVDQKAILDAIPASVTAHYTLLAMQVSCGKLKVAERTG